MGVALSVQLGSEAANITKHTLNSVVEILKFDTFSLCSLKKSNPLSLCYEQKVPFPRQTFNTLILMKRLI